VPGPVLVKDRMESLKKVENPVIPGWPATPAIRPDLAPYILDLQATIQLGKSLFWDMQAGSDNATACASCHSQAGADTRTRNQVNPGANSKYDALAANGDLQTLPASSRMVSPYFDDVLGSQGVRAASFKSVGSNGVETTTTPMGMRQVTGKNAPSVINTVFNHRQFWDGRAQADFNGVNPFGSRDSNARVFAASQTGVQPVSISISNASLASQAVGPALNNVEMSANGRTFPDLARKMLASRPLGLQQVDKTDSMLGLLVDQKQKGLNTSYAKLIQRAFQPQWWNSRVPVVLNGKSYSVMEANFSLFWGLAIMMYEATLVADDTPMDRYLFTRKFNNDTGALLQHDPALLAPAIARLVQSGVLSTNGKAPDGSDITTDSILTGLDMFELPPGPPPSFPAPAGFGAGCIACHVGAETTGASIRNTVGPNFVADHVPLQNMGHDMRMERMFMKMDWTPPGALTPVPLGSDQISLDLNTYKVNVTGMAGMPLTTQIALPVATYDVGWYNLGVRQTAEDLGLGASLPETQIKAPEMRPLSWTKLFQASANPSSAKVPGGSIGCNGAGNALFQNQLLNASGAPLLSGPLAKDEATAVDGSFKAAPLRNIEFTGPYFHNGGKATLAQVVSFYNSGGDFANPTKSPLLVPLQLTASQANGIIAFMLSLTDERVVYQKAPFDHPEIRVPNGEQQKNVDAYVTVPATGASGSPTPLKRFLNENPFKL